MAFAEGPRRHGGDLHYHRLVFRRQGRGAPRMGPGAKRRQPFLTEVRAAARALAQRRAGLYLREPDPPGLGQQERQPQARACLRQETAPQTPTAPSPTPPSRRGGGSTRTSAGLHRRGFVGAEFQGEGTLWGFYGLNHVVQARTLWDVDVDSTPCRRTTSAVSTERPPGRCGSCTNPSSGPSWSTSR